MLFAVLFFVSLNTILVGQVRSSGPAIRVSKAKGGQRENGFNSAASEANRVQLPQGAMFRQPSTTFVLFLVAIGRGIVSLMRLLLSVLYLCLRSLVWLHPTLY